MSKNKTQLINKLMNLQFTSKNRDALMVNQYLNKKMLK